MPSIGGKIVGHVDCKGGKAWLDRCVGRPIQVNGHYASNTLESVSHPPSDLLPSRSRTA